MGDVDVIIFHPPASPGAGPLERFLVDARQGQADDHRLAFARAGARTVRVVIEARPGPFGGRLRDLLAASPPDRGIVLLGSGAVPLATTADRRSFVDAAAADDPRALANNRFSADVVAISAAALPTLAHLPADFPADNALPRWLDEIGGVRVGDLRARWRLAMDLDSPLDVVLVGRAGGRIGRAAARVRPPGGARVETRLDGVRRVLADRRAELVLAGRTSAATIGWLERNSRCRVRALVEERGLRAASRLALGGSPGSARRPRSILGMALERDGPGALGARLAELGDAALVDSRVLLADRVGADEGSWPRAEARYASDLLDPSAIDDPWLAALTASAADAPIPVLLGGHSLVGPGVRLIAGGS